MNIYALIERDFYSSNNRVVMIMELEYVNGITYYDAKIFKKMEDITLISKTLKIPSHNMRIKNEKLEVVHINICIIFQTTDLKEFKQYCKNYLTISNL